MPRVLLWKGYRFYFWSHEPGEPPHVHIDKAEYTAKIWLDPVKMAYNEGYKAKELKILIEKVNEHQDEFLEAWHDHFAQ